MSEEHFKSFGTHDITWVFMMLFVMQQPRQCHPHKLEHSYWFVKILFISATKLCSINNRCLTLEWPSGRMATESHSV